MDTVEDCRQSIERQHRCRAEHRDSVQLTELVGGKLAFSGDVHVFALLDHRFAETAYAWLDQDLIVTVLGEPERIMGPDAAVRAWLARWAAGR